MFVDWGAPFPPLHAELTLCSGFRLPSLSPAAKTFDLQNVPSAVADAVAAH